MSVWPFAKKLFRQHGRSVTEYSTSENENPKGFTDSRTRDDFPWVGTRNQSIGNKWRKHSSSWCPDRSIKETMKQLHQTSDHYITNSLLNSYLCSVKQPQKTFLILLKNRDMIARREQHRGSCHYERVNTMPKNIWNVLFMTSQSTYDVTKRWTFIFGWTHTFKHEELPCLRDGHY